MSAFYSVAWKPMHKPALLPADAGQLPRVYFSIAWQAPLRPLYYPAEAMPVTRSARDAPWGWSALHSEAMVCRLHTRQ